MKIAKHELAYQDQGVKTARVKRYIIVTLMSRGIVSSKPRLERDNYLINRNKLEMVGGTAKSVEEGKLEELLGSKQRVPNSW